MSTPSILERISAGDESAVQECLSRYGGLVQALVRKLALDAAEAEDAVQEIFVELWRSAPRFDPAKAKEVTFVAMIARRRLIDRRRRRSRTEEAQSLDDRLDVAATTDSLRDVEIRDEAERARRAMAALRPEQRRVLELSIWHGLTHEQIAASEGMPLGTVKTHARRGLIRVRELLQGTTGVEEARR